MSKVFTVGIVGAGPAGCATAIQLARYGIDFILIEKRRVGGLCVNASLIENLPGFPSGITGRELAKNLSGHLKKLGIRPVIDTVVNVTWDKNNMFRIETLKETWWSHYLVVASGTKPRKWKIPLISGKKTPPERKIIDKYVVYEPIEIKGYGKTVCIVGGGEIAMDSAISLSEKHRVFLVNKNSQFRGVQVLREKLSSLPEVSIFTNTTITQLNLKNKKLVLTLQNDNTTKEVEVDVILVAIGREPEKSFLASSIIANENELLREGKLYYAGDVKNGIFRQTSIAMGDGTKAAMEIYFHIRAPEFHS